MPTNSKEYSRKYYLIDYCYLSDDDKGKAEAWLRKAGE